MADKQLTDKQRRFVEEYLVDLNATQAAIRAGYSEKTARSIGAENLAKPDIARAVSEAQDDRSRRTVIDQTWVLRHLREIVERSMQARQVLDRKGEPVLVETPDGRLVPAFSYDPASANRSLELIGKHLGMFTAERDRAASAEIGETEATADVRSRSRRAVVDEIVARFSTAPHPSKPNGKANRSTGGFH